MTDPTGPGPWGVYPIRGRFFVTREREAGKKDQEVHGSYVELEAATEISAFLESNSDLVREKETAYEDRNLLALAFAEMAILQGADVWIGRSEDPKFPVLYVQLPGGQVSWHIPRDLAHRCHVQWRDALQWDGHDVAEKRRRLERFAHLEPAT